MRTVSFNELINSDFISGTLYKSNGKGGTQGDVITRLFNIKDLGKNLTGIGNRGGIRNGKVRTNKTEVAFLALEDTGKNADYPNYFDSQTKILTYYGDNSTSMDVFSSNKKGNKHVMDTINFASSTISDRVKCPPIFYFQKRGSDVLFIGLAFPFIDRSEKQLLFEEYEAVKDNKRYKNLIFRFTIADDVKISHKWLYDLSQGKKYNSQYEPDIWSDFIENGNEMKIAKYQQSDEVNKIIKEENHSSYYFLEVRNTQQKFRDKLLYLKGSKCEICNIDNAKILVASHIIPWSISSDEEKTDENNGLLLCANHDKLFDKGLITFDKFGKIKISKRIKLEEYSELMIDKDLRIEVNKAKKQYLRYHNQKIFTEY